MCVCDPQHRGSETVGPRGPQPVQSKQRTPSFQVYRSLFLQCAKSSALSKMSSNPQELMIFWLPLLFDWVTPLNLEFHYTIPYNYEASTRYLRAGMCFKTCVCAEHVWTFYYLLTYSSKPQNIYIEDMHQLQANTAIFQERLEHPQNLVAKKGPATNMQTLFMVWVGRWDDYILFYFNFCIFLCIGPSPLPLLPII